VAGRPPKLRKGGEKKVRLGKEEKKKREGKREMVRGGLGPDKKRGWVEARHHAVRKETIF